MQLTLFPPEAAQSAPSDEPKTCHDYLFYNDYAPESDYCALDDLAVAAWWDAKTPFDYRRGIDCRQCPGFQDIEDKAGLLQMEQQLNEGAIA